MEHLDHAQISSEMESLLTGVELVQDWVGELIKILMIPVDYVVDPSYDALLKNQHLIILPAVTRLACKPGVLIVAPLRTCWF